VNADRARVVGGEPFYPVVFRNTTGEATLPHKQRKNPMLGAPSLTSPEAVSAVAALAGCTSTRDVDPTGDSLSRGAGTA
jgi:hypothetical protein